jgi:hypothetical protein
MMSNLTRGLLRLWIVSSGLWIFCVGWFTWPGNAPQQYASYLYERVVHPEGQLLIPSPEMQKVMDEFDCAAAKNANKPCPPSAKLTARMEPWSVYDWVVNDTNRWLSFVFLPPLAVLVLGAGLIWAIRGFRQG